jgi:mannitol/fructose-specific phosphotransferase system IIA component
VDFGGGNIAKIVIGIAGKGNEHLQILANIAESIEEESILNQLLTTKDSEYIYNLFSSEEMFGE